MSDLGDFFVGLLFGFLIAAALVGSSVHGINRDRWRADAVKRGYAEYNHTTGAWQWKVQPERANDE